MQLYAALPNPPVDPTCCSLLRHENIATTSQVYGAPQMEAKRELQRRLVDFVKRRAEQKGWKPKKDSWIECPTMTTSVQ